jgi:hypothetical protein
MNLGDDGEALMHTRLIGNCSGVRNRLPLTASGDRAALMRFDRRAAPLG